MAILFPTGLDNFTNPTAGDNLNTPAVLHSDQHANENDAIEALEAKVGIDGSLVTGSFDYRINYLETNQHAPVTLGIANGLSLSGQQISMGLAGANSTGTLSAADWNTFNSKQSALSFPLSSSLGGTSVSNTGTFTNHSNTIVVGGGTISLGGFTLTVPATGTAALLATANVFTAKQQITVPTTTAEGLILKTSDNSTTKNILEVKNSTDVNLIAINGLGSIGIGAAVSSVARLTVNRTATSDAVWAATISNLDVNAGATAITNGMYAHFVQAEVNASQSGAISGLNGIVGAINNYGTANVVNAYGMNFGVGNLGTGFIYNGYGIYISPAINTGGGFFANPIGLHISDMSVGWMSNTAIETGKGLVNFGDALTITGWQDVNQLVVTGFTTQTNPVSHLIDNTAATNVVRNLLRLEARSTNTVAVGFGSGLQFYAETATGGTYQQQGLISTSWVTATNASRAAKMSLSAYDTAARLGIEIEASGTAPMLGFYGVAPVARATNAIAAAAFVANTSGIVNDTATFGGYTLGQIAQALINVGILT